MCSGLCEDKARLAHVTTNLGQLNWQGNLSISPVMLDKALEELLHFRGGRS